MEQRKFLPTISELLDRLSIVQLKEVKIPEHKEEYAKEIAEIVHDIQLIINQNDVVINAEMLRAIIVCAQMNTHIWYNESNVRSGVVGPSMLALTHGLNGIRNVSKNKIQEVFGGRKDYKIDCIAADFKDWEISW
jgi:hypothetical protein